MATVSLQEKNGKFHAVINYKDKSGSRKQIWKSTGLKIRGNKKLAMIKANEILQDFINEENSRNMESCKNSFNEILFIDFMKSWLISTKNTIEITTYSSYELIIKDKMSKYFSEHKIKLVDIKQVDINMYYNYLYSLGLSGNTVLHHHAVIRKALNYAYRMDIISVNVADKVERPKKEQYIATYYNEEELNELLIKSKDDPMYLIIVITAYYGLRRSEVVGLKWDAFDFVNKNFTIKHTVTRTIVEGKSKIVLKDKTKNQSSYRTLPLIEEVEELLIKEKEKQEEFKKIFGKSYSKKYLGYVFVKEDGNLIKPGYVTEHFRNLLKKLKLRKIKFHELRHSCASLLLSKNIDMKSIQEWLGHSSYSTTANIYAHLDTNSKKHSAEVIANTFNIKKENEEKDSSNSFNKLAVSN